MVTRVDSARLAFDAIPKKAAVLLDANCLVSLHSCLSHIFQENESKIIFNYI